MTWFFLIKKRSFNYEYIKAIIINYVLWVFFQLVLWYVCTHNQFVLWHCNLILLSQWMPCLIRCPTVRPFTQTNRTQTRRLMVGLCLPLFLKIKRLLVYRVSFSLNWWRELQYRYIQDEIQFWTYFWPTLYFLCF